MTALTDLHEYLTSTLAGKYGDVVLSGVLDVEIADQAGRIRPKYRMADPAADWAGHAAPLREAILRRCARNLSLRKLPLGIQEGEAQLLRVGGRDGEIRRLEAPYLRMAVG